MRWFLWGIHLSQWWFVWNGSRYETSQLATAATGQTTGAAREWLLWLVTACLVITPFILCSPHPKQIRSCSMWCIIYQSIPKELRFWNKTWIIYQHLERGRWLLRLLIITSRLLLKEVPFLYFYSLKRIDLRNETSVKNDNDVIQHDPTLIFTNKCYGMIWLLI